MMKLLLCLAAFLGACTSSGSSAAPTCRDLPSLAGADADASAALADCLRAATPGGRLSLQPGIYRLNGPIIVHKPITIVTQGLAAGEAGCAELKHRRCATLLLDPHAASFRPGTMPIHIAADGVTFSHLIIRGVSGARPQRDRDYCGTPDRRPLAGGLRITGSDFTLRKSLVRDFACYSAVEVTASAQRPRVRDNHIGPNGDHRPGEIWTDGVTVHDTNGAVIIDNRFVDNTDVQLILGGCRDCRIENNVFRHSGAFSRASFAELMLHAWPTTSGNYAGTVVRGNHVDCGVARRCGYGIMIGSAPWYAAPTSGGTVVGNHVANAKIGINIDGLTGPMEVRNNEVRASGGRYDSDCGQRNWPGANIAPGSKGFLRFDPSDAAEGSLDTSGCLINRLDR